MIVTYTKAFSLFKISSDKLTIHKAKKIFDRIIKSTDYKELSRKVALYNQEVSKLDEDPDYEDFASEWLTVDLVTKFYEHDVLDRHEFPLASVGEQGAYVYYDLSIKKIITDLNDVKSNHNYITTAVKAALKCQLDTNMQFAPSVVKEATNLYNKYFK